MKALRLVPEETNINFIGMRFIAFAVSLLLMVGSVGLAGSKGLNFGIDFTGGSMIEIRVPDEQPDLGDLRERLNALGLGAVSIQEFGQPDDLLIRMPEQVESDAEIAEREACMEQFLEQSKCPNAQARAIETLRGSLTEAYPDGEIDYRRVEFVGPQVGEELKKQGLYAILFSLLGILIYIWFRFEWQFGVAAIVALAHDAIATVGLFALTQMEFNLSTVAAVLMIAGYSINDTVVVFDRIRENLQKFKKKPLKELFNLSVNQMLSRTLMTSITTLLALLALWYFGGEVIRGFVNALIFGVLIGTYSSVFVAAPILLFMNVRKKPSADKKDDEEQGQTQPA